MSYQCVKRAGDVLAAAIGIVLLLPVMAVVALMIRLDSKGPAVLRQKRFGKGKRIFWLYKFRSMKQDTPEVPTHLMKNAADYTTRVGKVIRKTSIDELPQLVNILKGDMSLIGPRPALWNQEDLIEQRELYGANDVRPGLTGWAQVNGRDELSTEMKAKMDGEYVSHFGFSIDLKCFFKTIRSVIRREGVLDGGSTKQ